MNMYTRVKNRIQASGFRGLTASVLHKTAKLIDGKSADTPVPVSIEEEIQKENEFLKWVEFAVPGMLNRGNVDAIEYALAKMPPDNPIMEIGSFCGLSTTVISYFLDKHSLPIPFFTCDKWEFEGQTLGAPLGDSQSVTHDDYRTYVRDTFLSTMNTFATNRLPYTIECFSDEFFDRWHTNKHTVDVFGRPVTLGGMMSFCYIDGNHQYDFVKRDFENINRTLVPGGFILFDDSADGSGWGSNKVAHEVASKKEYEVVSKQPNYLLRKI